MTRPFHPIRWLLSGRYRRFRRAVATRHARNVARNARHWRALRERLWREYVTEKDYGHARRLLALIITIDRGIG